MEKKFLIITMISIFFAINAFSQTATTVRPPLDRSNPNYEHDRITYMWLDSQYEPVSQQAITILKNRALALNMPEAKMMRNQYIFRILENKKLSVEDRLWAADFFIKASQYDISYPLEYIKTIKSNISTK
jgi:hypothetical protein